MDMFKHENICKILTDKGLTEVSQKSKLTLFILDRTISSKD
jgi:hypothetical protein